MDKIVERFLSYTRFDTTSEEQSNTCPSTDRQLVLARRLTSELSELGLKNVSLDDNGYVMAELPANIKEKVPVVGFIAHMDTVSDVCGADVRARIIEQYDGSDVRLDNAGQYILSPQEFSELNNYVGQDIIVTDGQTLLGADDKAGIAAIIDAAEYLLTHPEIKHGTVKIAFTPDEEIGRGADHFDIAKFGAAYAFTVDGGAVGEMEYETFNACDARIHIKGKSVHTGSAKNKLINALHIAMELHAMLPPAETPQHTEGYEGFYHLRNLSGNVDEANMAYIIRDHDWNKFTLRKQRMEKIVSYLNDQYGANTVSLSLEDSYYNMREKIEPVMYIVDLASQAMKELDILPQIKPVRGGTDGCVLSYKGLPCPNIFTGGHNFHGRFEYLPIESMKKASMVVRKIIELTAQKVKA